MYKRLLIAMFICFNTLAISAQNDTIVKRPFLKSLGEGYLPTNYFNFDLRYLIKFNQYEGLRTGFGGETTNKLFKNFKVNGYVVYGFKDHRFKYSIGGQYLINKTHNTWLGAIYTSDLQETGSIQFLTDKRVFQFFEPRLLNIDLFHKHRTTSVLLSHEFNHKLALESNVALSHISPTYNYNFVLENNSFNSFKLATVTSAVLWNPFSTKQTVNKQTVIKQGYPSFSFQYTKGIKDVFNSNLNFHKIDFKTLYYINPSKDYKTQITLTSGLAIGHLPLTHLYHAYPNNITKETILQRFSVAGLNSFETMYFNEFFSDKFSTIQLKQYIKSFNISKRFKPQLVLISRFAIGDMSNTERHENITFKTLEKGYTESGFELNKLLFGFGLSATYRYGAYYLPKFEDNIAIKFTFNITL